MTGKSLMVLYFLLKQTNDDELRISQHWKKHKAKRNLKTKHPGAKHFCLEEIGTACSKRSHRPVGMLIPHAQEEVHRSQVYRQWSPRVFCQHSMLSCTLGYLSVCIGICMSQDTQIPTLAPSINRHIKCLIDQVLLDSIQEWSIKL